MAAVGHTKWTGDLQSGEGNFDTESGAVGGTFTAATRFGDDVGTNPEELIAAAHSACFSMALSNILVEAGHDPTSVDTTARVTIKEVDGDFEINRIRLSTEGVVPEISEEDFVKHAEEAKAGCPVSKALAGVGEITLEAKLTS